MQLAAASMEATHETSPSTKSTTLARTAGGGAAAVLSGQILIFGGEAPSGTFDVVESYDPHRDTWSPAMPMPTARHGLGSVTADGRVYVIAGGTQPGGTQPGGSASAHNEIFSRSP
jgi:N-acetylneuraminic acid mutarotase